MFLIKRYPIIVVALVVGVLIGGGVLVYSWTQNFQNKDIETLVSAGAIDPLVAERSDEILDLLRDLKRLSFDETLFSDPRFRNLVDFGVELLPEPKGRRNPFAPLGEDGGGGPASVEDNDEEAALESAPRAPAAAEAGP